MRHIGVALSWLSPYSKRKGRVILEMDEKSFYGLLHGICERSKAEDSGKPEAMTGPNSLDSCST
ncbi:MAG: hypothetical protein PHD76_12325 [Methylacidiphilales bacterium]|nr:hypothetical protein [Candidatus Methylacidiphilales bacterium]